MEKELINFIQENNLNPFNNFKSQTKNNSRETFKTKDAKSIQRKVLSIISQNFVFSETSNLLNLFDFTDDKNKLEERRKFFQEIKMLGKKDNSFLKKIKFPRQNWKPQYDIVVVTEKPETFTKLKEMNCPCQLVISETDIALLESKDLVQIIDCDEYSLALENLPQSVFIKNIQDVYLERHLEQLSGWKENLKILSEQNIDDETRQITNNLNQILELIAREKTQSLTRDFVESEIEKINSRISEKIKQQTFSGESLINVLNKGLPDQIKQIVMQEIRSSQIPAQVILPSLPVSVNEEELERIIKNSDANRFTSFAEMLKSQSNFIKEIPRQIQKLKEQLIIIDFIFGLSKFIKENSIFPEYSEDFSMINSKNLFLENPQPISFYLNQQERCSILTGANSGGKTTLIEHILQIITLSQIGLPLDGKIKIPLFTEIYYFAKNKGSMNKGAFETLLSQMSTIKPGEKTLILADEIEAVTEPGVAGKIISATAKYFLEKKCYLVIATHLGYEIQKDLPAFSRIDGIEAKGLTQNFELIVDHNPVLGRLAHSTPELIVEKMANSEKKDYFIFLNEYIKRQIKPNI